MRRSRPDAPVAPPWLPMHGTRKGRAPRSLNQSTVARTICGKPAIPREPTPMATSPLGRRRSATPDAFRASRTERGISESPSSGMWRVTRCRKGSSIPVSSEVNKGMASSAYEVPYYGTKFLITEHGSDYTQWPDTWQHEERRWTGSAQGASNPERFG